MNQSNRCEQCGGPLPAAGALGGRCPRCLLEAGLHSSGDDQATETFAPPFDNEQATVLPMPARIARYRVARLIGQGGMGAVYEAEQEHPRRTVALKVIKPGMASPELLRRFEQEAQALGRLQHPGIAQIYEAGTADTGFGPQPYFAMEYVRGLSLVKYAIENRLSTRARLEIMARVCDAVHHAHQRSLIHRDLKPSNILVDESGQPKIVDFGVARLTDHDTQATSRTDAGQLIGTVAYMSPEQVLADPLEIDTRSDVYAVGVIMYELLAGRLPYNISSNKFHEALSAIREEDPTRLSSVSADYRGDVETIVAKALEKEKTRRYGSTADLANDIRRHLADDPITARPPSVGYQLQKFTRRHKALVAGVAAVFLVLVAGIAASTWQAARAGRAEQVAVAERDRAVNAEEKAGVERDRATEAERAATRERDRAVTAETKAQRERDSAVTEKQRADTEAATAKAVQDFLGNDLLRMANPTAQARSRQPNLAAVRPTPNLTVKEALDRAATTIQGKFDKEPLVEAAIRETIGGTYLGLGRDVEAREQLELAVALRRRHQSGAHPDALKSTLQLATTYLSLRIYEKAEELVKLVVQDTRRGPGDDNPSMRSAISLWVSMHTDLNNTDRERGFLEAERFLKNDIIAYQRRTLGDENTTTRYSISALLALYRNQTRPRYAEAEAFLKQLVQDQRGKLGEANPTTLSSVTQLASLYMTQPEPKYAEAETLLKLVVDGRRRKLGDDHIATMSGINMLLNVYMTQPQPKYAEAETFLTPLLKEQRDKLGTTSHAARNSAIQLANLYFKQSKYREAEDLLPSVVTDDLVTRVMQGGRKTLEENPSVYAALDLSAQIQRKKGNSAQADALTLKLRQVLGVGVKSALNSVPGSQNLESPLLTAARLAMEYLSADRYTEAEETFNTVLEGYRQVAGNGPSAQIANLVSVAARQYTTKGMDVQAEKLLTALVDIHQDVLGDGDPLTHAATGVLAQWYLERRKYTVAQETFVHLLQIQSNSMGPTHINTRGTMNALALAYLAEAKSFQAQGKPEPSRHAYEKLAEIQAQHLAIFRNELGGLQSSNARITMGNLGHSYGVLGKYSQAEELFTELLAIQRSAAGMQPAPMLEATAALGWAQFHQRKYSEAETNLRAALRGSEQISLDAWERHNFESMLGAVLVAEKKFAEAERHLLASHEMMLQRQTRMNYNGFISEAVPGERILRLYEEWGNPDQAAEWRKKLLATTSRVEPGK